MKVLKDKVVAITGAGSGIGKATALLLASQGCHLALSDIDEAAVQTVAQSCRQAGVRVGAARLDVADREAVYAWADAVAKEHGQVHVIINNAGVALAATVEDMSYEDFEWLMNINFWGVVYGTKAFLPHLKTAGEGHVVNISSVFGLIGVPTQSAYNAAKFAVKGFTESLREELAIEGAPIGVTCVHPGGIKTNIAASARMTPSSGFTGPGAKREMERAFMTTPEAAAETIVRAIRRNQRRLLIGPDARVIDLLSRLLPVHYQDILVLGGRMRRRSLLKKA
ncbi:MAG: SDR family NAD(P)-dependent oxidoreductase [Pseudomonadales bacterium]|nr:SDR family NAD(P)-dependent oxidoreductase [Pseudomonadales bacterium]